ncbi:MAG: HAD-IA family hydrolase [bacterium]|nr:HAD-IA family hydrolase [bacterium]
MGRKLVIFDFDGVIADSWDICFETIRIWYPQLTEQQYRDSFNGNIRDASWRDSDIKMNYYDHYDPRLLASKPFMGIPEVVRVLAKQYRLFLISSTPAPVIREYLRINDIDVFEQVLGHETHKYKDVKLRIILDETKASPAETVMISDTLGDILEARKAGVKVISVLWGFQNKKTLLLGNPVAVVEHPRELPKSVDNFFSE